MALNRDDITLTLAILGSVLGLLNFIYQRSKDKVRLKVTPKLAYPIGAIAVTDDRPRLCIDVINMSAFPVTVSGVGLTLWWSRRELGLIQPLIYDGKPWPRRLDAREAMTVYFSPSIINDATLLKVCRAYAKTDCGERRYGNSKALQVYKKQAEEKIIELLAKQNPLS